MGYSRAYPDLARIELDLGNWERATERFQQALDRARDLRDVQTTGVSLMNLGSMAVFSGRPAEAEEPLNAALGEDAFALALLAMENFGFEEAITFGLGTGTTE